MQRPPPARFGRDADALLESYISVDDGASVDLAALEARAAREGYIRNRVNWLQHQGRLLRLLDEEEEKANAALIAENKQRAARHERRVPIGPPPRKTDHHDALLAHMTQVRHAIIADAKMKPVVCRKIARMIQLHWEHIHTKDERAAIAEERERKRKAKEVVKALKKRWGLAIKVSIGVSNLLAAKGFFG
jgi:helicase SWR1